MVNGVKHFYQVHKKNMCGQVMLPLNLQGRFKGVKSMRSALLIETSILALKSLVTDERVDAEGKDRLKDLVGYLKQINS
eukprot:1754752-Ditylum_brightwellii.AAC.1